MKSYSNSIYKVYGLETEYEALRRRQLKIVASILIITLLGLGLTLPFN